MEDPADPNNERGEATVQGVDEAESSLLGRGTSVGRYTVLELLGRGGMGAVYKAYDPELDRLIALKVITPHSSGSESSLQAHGRVMREAQALAQLSHPNVVAVHDVGKYEGSVYIAMELVEGKTGREWLKEGRPSRKEILEVFRQAGLGLLAAHQAGLVHRDFKPANMILGKDGRVRVADFGLVRSLSAPPTPATEPAVRVGSLSAREVSLESGKYLSATLTQSRSFLGTPQYMPPEQYLGKAIDGRADQYSFCVCLFEALYGERPFQGKDLSELVENVLNGRRKAQPVAVEVPDWLRVIVEKGLSQEASDRYPSMRELLDALAVDPEEAAQKAREVRRRSIQYAVGLGAALASGVLFATFFLARERELCRGGEDLLSSFWNEEVKAKVREAFVATGKPYAVDTVERVRGHLDRWASEWVAAHTEACEATHTKGQQSEKILDLRMGCLGRKLSSLKALVGVLAEKPDGQMVDKAVQAALGLGGLAFCADVKALMQQEEPPEKPEDRQTLSELRGRLEKANQLDKLGKYGEAASLLKELAPRVLALGFPPLRAELLYYTSSNLERLGKYAEAEPVLKEAIQLALKWGMKELAARAGSEATFLFGYFLQRFPEGLTHAFYAQGLTSGRGDELEALALNNQGIVCHYQGSHAEAEVLYKRALAIWEKTRGPDHPSVATSLNNLAIIYRLQGKYVEAEGLHKKALAIRQKAFGPDHPDVAMSLTNLANVELEQEKYAEAEELQKRALAIWEKTLGSDHLYVAESLVGLAENYERQNRFAEALPLLERTRKIREKDNVASAMRADAAFAFARVLFALGKDRGRARSIAQEALDLFQTAGPGAEKQRREVERWIAEHR